MMAVALNAINAPDLPLVAGMPSGMDLATVLQVPVTCLSDIAVVARNYKNVAWSIIPPLLSTTVVGIAAGQQLMGKIPPDTAKAPTIARYASGFASTVVPTRARRGGGPLLRSHYGSAPPCAIILF